MEILYHKVVALKHSQIATIHNEIKRIAICTLTGFSHTVG